MFPAIDRNDIDGATARFDGLFAEREGALADGTGVEKEPEAGEQCCGSGVCEQRSV